MGRAALALGRRTAHRDDRDYAYNFAQPAAAVDATQAIFGFGTRSARFDGFEAWGYIIL